jgi:hypothetical protein
LGWGDWVADVVFAKKLAAVVQADFLNERIADILRVKVTSTKHGIPGTEV